ncbi:MAG: sulfite oxidase [Pseudomonadota bacterium]
MSDKPTNPGRRDWLRTASAAAAWRSLGTAVPHWRLISAGLLPVVATAGNTVLEPHGKGELRLLNDRPLNAETPAHLLDDAVTPTARHFVRNNGFPPAVVTDPDAWAIQVHGEACAAPRTVTVGELKQRFRQVTLQLQLECGGNGRAEFRPRASGNPWTTGGIGCAEWRGIRVVDLLDDIGMADTAVYVAYCGADTHLSGAPDKDPISRGVPVAKALEPESLLAFEMNGAPIPHLHGAPARLVFGGWPASTSGKWVNELLIRDRVHDGAKMGGKAYRMPCEPMAPGAKAEDDAMCIIESMPVKSLITFPESGSAVAVGKRFEVRGHAWAGDYRVKRMHVSTDFGATWQRARLSRPANRLAWQHFRAELTLDTPGYYEVWARATDSRGVAQPMLVPGWNPKGYLNNACHRIAVQVT